MTDGPLIYKKMPLIMAEVGPIEKARRNAQQGYDFRGIDDVYQALQTIMAAHGVFSLPTVLEDRTEERTTKAGSALIYRILKIRYDFYAEDGSAVPAVVIGEGMDSGDKASNKAMSVAEKYALLQAFKIPTREAKDPENDSHDVAPKKAAAPRKAAAKTKGITYEPTDDGIPPPDDRVITPEVYAESRQRLAAEIKRDQAAAQELDEIPFGSHGPDEVYTARDSQKLILEKDAKRIAKITDIPTLRKLSAAMKEHAIFVSDLPRGIADWVKETGYTAE